MAERMFDLDFDLESEGNLSDLVRAVLGDALQLGIVLGACVGALVVAFAGARRGSQRAWHATKAGVILAPADAMALERAARAAQAAIERVEQRRDLTNL
jgi:hypothetical protein